MAEVLSNDVFWWFVLVGGTLWLAYAGVSRVVWMVAGGIAVLLFLDFAAAGWLVKLLVLVLYAAPAVLFSAPELRRRFISRPLLDFYRRAMPEISATERDALDAGTVWWDAELFSGKPSWRKLLDFPSTRLSAEEQAFLEGPVQTLCGMLEDYRINNELHDLPDAVWQYIRQQGFFGMIVPKEYGGKGFSAAGHAAVVMKIASRSITAALTVMIPNSVGPAKLLLKYGTSEQKQQYLPKLASGDEIPCFALTSPEAGSDAGAITDTGVVCRRPFQGHDNVLGIRLNFEKRYITLAPVATVLGVAFKLEDPEHLLSDRENPGITLALVPADAPGVSKGSRHKPMHLAFQNGPVSGKDVFIPVDWIIGGAHQAGNGWRMLIECLTDGRAISLPALSTGAAKTVSRITGAYARVREQFKQPIGHFEGVQEALARIGGNTYAMNAARLLTLAALDAGHKPAVISSIVKYNLTDRCREVVTDALEVHGGAGLCLGPHNVLGEISSFPPLAVTVEGHNILTRNLITFGQGAIRSHPYLLQELQAAAGPDERKSLLDFDRVALAHTGFMLSNVARTLLLGVTFGLIAPVPLGIPSRVRYYLRQLSRMSAAFAMVTDALVITMRGDVKRRERLSARMADVLSQLYLASAAIKQYADDGYPHADLPLLDWVCRDCLYQIQESFDALFRNLPPRGFGLLLRALVFPFGRRYGPPGDTLDGNVATILMTPGTARDRLAAGMYIPDDAEDPMTTLEDAFARILGLERLQARLKEAVKQGTVTATGLQAQLAEAVAKGIFTESEAQSWRDADRIRRQALRVDDFPGNF